MERYFLLRDNQETGPYQPSDLKGKPLLSTDLLWLEGESTSWKHPHEFEVFKGYVLTPSPKPGKTSGTKTTSPQQSEKLTRTTYSSSINAVSSELTADGTEPEFKPDFEELKKKYSKRIPKKRVWKPQVNIGANLFGLATLLIGVMLAAFMLKKAVDSIDTEPMVATAEAGVITVESLPESATSHAALGSLVPVPVKADAAAETEKADQEVIQQELTVVVKSTVETAAKKPEPQTVPGLVKTVTKEEEKPDASAGKGEKQDEEMVAVNQTKEDADKPEDVVKKSEAKPSIKLALNDYKVGFLGGISNLELSVTNPSSHKVSRAVVEVEYLKPNGKVANTQTVEISGIAPGASKQVSVPNSSRGVSVRYKIISVEA